MNPNHRFPFSRRAGTLVAVLMLASALPSCVYRPTIQQGNLLQYSDIQQIKPGMTRSQVRYVLGTPMVSDPFEPDRWDYVYTLQQGRSKHVDRSHVIVYFEGDKVSKVETRDNPEETETQKIIRKQREAAGKAEAAPGAPVAPAAGANPDTAATGASGETPAAPPPQAPVPPSGG